MTEQWKDIEGFEGRYQVSDLGRIKALPRLQRYTHWRTGQELFRQTKEKIAATQYINSGYAIVHLHRDNTRTALLVHRLVALAFLRPPVSQTVNHKNGIKADNRAVNLEWATYTENHLHAVEMGLNKSAIPVVDPKTGIRYISLTQAAKYSGSGLDRVRKYFIRAGAINA